MMLSFTVSVILTSASSAAFVGMIVFIILNYRKDKRKYNEMDAMLQNILNKKEEHLLDLKSILEKHVEDPEKIKNFSDQLLSKEENFYRTLVEVYLSKEKDRIQGLEQQTIALFAFATEWGASLIPPPQVIEVAETSLETQAAQDSKLVVELHDNRSHSDIKGNYDSEPSARAPTKDVFARADAEHIQHLEKDLKALGKRFDKAEKLLNTIFQEYTAMTHIDAGEQHSWTVEEIEEILKNPKLKS